MSPTQPTTSEAAEPDLKPGQVPDRKLRYAYLCSPPHSGSTLMAFLLGAHPEIATVGEFGAIFPPHIRCACGQRVPDCPVWREWSSRARAEGIEFPPDGPRVSLQPDPDGGRLEDLFHYHFPTRWMDRLRDLAFPSRSRLCRKAGETCDRALRLAEMVREIQGGSVFLDTNKSHFQLRFLARDPRVRLQAIVLLRDGRATINSLMLREKRDLDTAVGEWLWCCRNLERAVRHYVPPEDVFRLRLEDLCRRPDEIRTALFRFLQVDSEVKLNFSDRSRFHIMGNQMRLNFDGQIKLDERWKDDLSPEQLRTINARIGPVNRRYGYDG